MQCFEIIASLTTFTHNSIIDMHNCNEFWISISLLTLIYNSVANIHNWIMYTLLNYGYPLLNIYFNIHNWIKFEIWQHYLMASLIHQGHEFNVLSWRVNIIFILRSLSWPGHLMILWINVRRVCSQCSQIYHWCGNRSVISVSMAWNSYADKKFVICIYIYILWHILRSRDINIFCKPPFHSRPILSLPASVCMSVHPSVYHRACPHFN